ncbi:MAG: sulfotransferase domain-containing protein [Candidatus Eisenbacteria bacterium]
MALETLKRHVGRVVPADIKRLCHGLGVERSVPYENGYHCCTQKTASQTLRAVFSDPIFHRYSGLWPHVFSQDPEHVQDAMIDHPFPRRTMGTNLYIDHPTFLEMPKPVRYKALFVLRDPRDIVTSWYFSARYSHRPTGLIPQFRSDLERLDLSEGLKYSIDTLQSRGLFQAQLSWVHATDDQIKLVRYEDLAADQRGFLRGVLDFLEVEMPADQFVALCDRHRFEVHSGGRKAGIADLQSHYRNGTAGDWMNHFDQSVIAHFKEVTGSLLEELGYSQ